MKTAPDLHQPTTSAPAIAAEAENPAGLQESEFKRAEEASRVNEARFRSAFGFAPHGMALVSPAGRFLQVNRFLCQMLGYSETELLQLRFQDISHPDELEASATGIKDLLDDRVQLFEIQKKYLHKDGHVVWGLLTVAVFCCAMGRESRFILYRTFRTLLSASRLKRPCVKARNAIFA